MRINRLKYNRIDRKKNAKNTLSILLLLLSIAFVSMYRDEIKSMPHTLVSPLPTTVHAQEVKPTPVPVTDEEIFTYAIHVFGKEGKDILVKMVNCFYSESGWRANAIHKNENGTLDAGIAQVNDIHGMSLQDRLDYKKNIDKAYAIYKGRGSNFSAWYGRLCN